MMCREFNHGTGSRCILNVDHDGPHQSMAYPGDAQPYVWSWENYPAPKDLVDKKLGT